jgi:hypothetical protein
MSRNPFDNDMVAGVDLNYRASGYEFCSPLNEDLNRSQIKIKKFHLTNLFRLQQLDGKNSGFSGRNQ